MSISHVIIITLMARFKHTDNSQGQFMVINLNKQLILGSFEMNFRIIILFRENYRKNIDKIDNLVEVAEKVLFEHFFLGSIAFAPVSSLWYLLSKIRGSKIRKVYSAVD